MSDKNKPVTDQPAADKPVVEPKAEEPTSGQPASATSDVASAGTDQYGRQLFNVTCASCGKPTQVPFKPSGDRPVYCRDCYMQQRKERRGGGMNRGPRR